MRSGVTSALKVAIIAVAGFASTAATDPYPDYRIDYYNDATEVGRVPPVGYTIYYCDNTQQTFGFVTGEENIVDLGPCP